MNTPDPKYFRGVVTGPFPSPDPNESLEACRILGIDTSGDYDYLGTLRAVVVERDELRLEIAAMRGQPEGRISDRWTWEEPCWVIDEGGVTAKVATTNLMLWADDKLFERTGSSIEQATSIRDGMRRCEARLAGGAS